MPFDGDAFLISAISLSSVPLSTGVKGIGASAARARSFRRSRGSAAVRAASSSRLSATMRSRIVSVAVVRVVIEALGEAHVAVERLDRRAGIDRLRRQLDALAHALRQPGDDERRARV